MYAITSHQHSFARYTRWIDLRFKNDSASDFVRKFQEALRDLTAQNLKVDEKNANLMDQVYVEFLEVDIHNRFMNPSHASANTTAFQSSSSSSNQYKKKDTRKGSNDKQNNNNSFNKDRSSKKKTDFVREDIVIFCSHHGVLGNHFTSKCPLLKNSANATMRAQPQHQPQIQQVAVPQLGQIIGQVDSQGRVHFLPQQQQQPRQGANSVFVPASYATTPQQGRHKIQLGHCHAVQHVNGSPQRDTWIQTRTPY
ncbi:hypothetical protein PITC_001760 [Penicillium italicum]|uniref:Uncharacterized protein n=1 Tax=Penicillium italicum TaxID=40296 RepID=A0A0A2L5D9_PENIT|nr:hypothetical protein PITC_001760 [Penicillium italicum]